MDTNDITQQILAALPGAEVMVWGEDGAHFRARVVYAAFEGKGTLARHRLVYAALGKAVGREIHALSLQTLTPEEARDGAQAG